MSHELNVNRRPALDGARNIAAFDLAAWGLADVAYVKSVVVDGRRAFAIHAANGEPLGLTQERDVAFAAIRQQEMAPLSVH